MVIHLDLAMEELDESTSLGPTISATIKQAVATYFMISENQITIEFLAGSVIAKVMIKQSLGQDKSGRKSDTAVLWQQRLVVAFETGSLQELMPQVPIAHVDANTRDHFL